MKPNWDVYTQLYESTIELKEIFNVHPCKHIKGHQDDNVSLDQLHWIAQLNCRCDHHATQILREYDERQQEIMYPLTACPAYLLINKTYTTAKSIQYIEDCTNEQALQTYHKNRFKWTESTYRSIDWDAVRASRAFKTTDITYTTKLCNKWLPTCKHLHTTKERESPTCINCPEIETQAHIFQCPAQTNGNKTLSKH